MKKFFIPALALGCVLVAAPCLGAQTASAESAPVNMLNNKSDWSIFTGQNSVFNLADGAIEIVPTDSSPAATYITHSYKNAVIEFDYQLSYDPSVNVYTEETGYIPQTFFGILFGNNITIDSKWDPVRSLPHSNGSGGYPYMLTFDTERQDEEGSIRYSQVGLSLRRYPYNGYHNYAARWSTVDPAEGEYNTTNGKAYSKMPEFSKPVKVSDCFDTDAHKVKIDYRAQYVADGAEKDAMAINVWFDDELVLTVLDDVPFEGEEWGEKIDIDKRDKNGYIGIYAYHGVVSDAALYDYKINVSRMTITDLGAIGSGASDDENKGCSGSVQGMWGLVVAVPAIAAVAVVLKKRGNA